MAVPSLRTVTTWRWHGVPSHSSSSTTDAGRAGRPRLEATTWRMPRQGADSARITPAELQRLAVQHRAASSRCKVLPGSAMPTDAGDELSRPQRSHLQRDTTRGKDDAYECGHAAGGVGRERS